MDNQVGFSVQGGWFAVDDDQTTFSGSIPGEGGGGIDYQGGTDHAEEVGLLNCFLRIEPVLLREGFTEEGYFRLVDPAAGVIGDLSLPDHGMEFPGGDPMPAFDAAAEFKIPVNAPDGPAPCPLVEIIDILGNDGHQVGLLESGDGQMSRIGEGVFHDLQELSRELIERFWIGQEGGNIEDVNIFRIAVKAVSGTEVRNSALGGYAGAGQKYNSAGLVDISFKLPNQLQVDHLLVTSRKMFRPVIAIADRGIFANCSFSKLCYNYSDL